MLYTVIDRAARRPIGAHPLSDDARQAAWVSVLDAVASGVTDPERLLRVARTAIWRTEHAARTARRREIPLDDWVKGWWPHPDG
jgi:hypothetical protein